MELFFQLSNFLVIPFWALMIVFPYNQNTIKLVHSSVMFIPIALLYSVLVLPDFLTLLPELANPQLAVLQNLLSSAEGTITAWIHFLAFDLFVGRWIFIDSTTKKFPRHIQVLCLVATFMIGPFGLLLYIVIRRLRLGSFALN